MIVEVMNSLLGLSWLHQRFGAGTVPGGVMVASFFSKSGSLAMFAAMRLASMGPPLDLAPEQLFQSGDR